MVFTILELVRLFRAQTELVRLFRAQLSAVASLQGAKKGSAFQLSLLKGGDYLLFRFRSTIGVIRFNFSVRNGKRWSPYAFITLISFRHSLRCVVASKETRRKRKNLQRHFTLACQSPFRSISFSGTPGQLVPLG